jgi:hypothetical protein
MAVPVPSISCCVLNYCNLFYHIWNALAFNWDKCCHLALCLWLLPFHFIKKNLIASKFNQTYFKKVLKLQRFQICVYFFSSFVDCWVIDNFVTKLKLQYITGSMDKLKLSPSPLGPMLPVGLHHPLDGVTNPEYKFLRFIQLIFCKEKKALAFNRDRCCHLMLCLQLILFH